MGQNMYATSGNNVSAETAVNCWYNEKPLYNNNCTDTCGHYTQVCTAKKAENI